MRTGHICGFLHDSLGLSMEPWDWSINIACACHMRLVDKVKINGPFSFLFDMHVVFHIRMRSFSVKKPSASPVHQALLHLSKAPSTLVTCDFKEAMHLKRSVMEYPNWSGICGCKMFLGETECMNMAIYNDQD